MISKSKQKQIARERMEILFEEAKKAFRESPLLSNRYITLARKISMKLKVPIPKQYKKLFCKNCYKFLQPGKTLRARIKNKTLIYNCSNCNFTKRYPLRKR